VTRPTPPPLPGDRAQRVNILGVGVHALDLPRAVERVLDAAATPGLTGYVTVTGVHGVMESQRDDDLKRIHNRSLLSVPDGTPTVWVGRSRGWKDMRTVRGSDLMGALLDQGLEAGLRHYFYGGAEGVVRQLAGALEASHPGLRIAGVGTPPFRPLTEDEEVALVDELNATRPHLLWIGLSTPKQERFMAGFLARHRNELNLADHGLVLLGVGAAFDFKAGLVQEAPQWVQGTGLEWAYRTAKEPRRLWKRYATNNPAFVAGLIDQLRHPERYPMLGAEPATA
jgi:N-acetylglucosaminyldiphosphoundecaprenol N-acetyl-beta-D-mannosaminyltransferase